MHREYRFLPSVFAGLATLLLGCGNELPRIENIVIVSIDTLHRDELRVFDPSAQSLPHLDAFAADAVGFAQALSPAAWTLPAHASLLTGLYPDRHGATDRRRVLSPKIETLAGALKREGWRTVAFTDGGFVDREYGLGGSFDRYDRHVRDPALRSFVLPRNGKPNKHPGASLFDRAIAFLEDPRATEQPLLLFLHSYGVHDYYRLHPWALARLPGPPPEDRDHYRACLRGGLACDRASWFFLRKLYESSAQHMDAAFGRLLDALDAADLRERTAVVVLSDHGEGLDPERARIHHGGRLHEDQLRVPLLVAIPGLDPGIVSERVSLVDVMPTLLELAGAPLPKGLDGRSLAGLLRGEPAEASRALFALEHYHYWQEGRRGAVEDVSRKPLQIAVVRGDHWYIRHASGVEQLYEMAGDPSQNQDLAAASSEEIRTMRSLAAVRDQFVPPIVTRGTDPELDARLRALGYVE